MRLPALLLATLALAGCGSTQSTGAFGETPLVLNPVPVADDAGVYLATTRGYDEAEGVELQLKREGTADFYLTPAPPPGCVAVLAIVRPDKLVLCVDPVILRDERDKVLAVARALRRGYTQAQLEPEESVAAMSSQIPDLDREGMTKQLDAVIPTWTAGAPFFGELAPGQGRDPSVAEDAREDGGH